MLNINTIREAPDIVRKDLKKRGDNDKLKLIDEFLKLDQKWKKLRGNADDLKRDRNKLSEEVNSLMKSGNKTEAQKVIKKAKALPPKIEKAEAEANKLREKIDAILMSLPNILHESVPTGKDDSDNKEVRKWGNPETNDWLKSHAEIVELHGGNFDKSAKVAGHGFYYLSGGIALLNQALIRFAIDYMTKQGFTYTETPLMLRRDAYEGVVSMDDFEKVMYKVEDEDLYLIATSEHSLITQFKDEGLQRKKLPIKLSSYSMCFRKEVGTHNVDEKGLFRTHQFNKVEMVVVCEPKDSWDWHEKMVAFSEGILKELKLPYRVVNVCTGDIGSIAAKKYDVEVWLPRQKAYREIMSCSNCTDYQARRLGIRYESPTGGYDFVHTLNNTALATSRAMVAILENYQNKDGSITVPKVLVPYVGMKKITP